MRKARCLDPETIFNALCFVQERIGAFAERRAPLPHWREDWPALRVLRVWGYVEHTPAGWLMTSRGDRLFRRMDGRA